MTASALAKNAVGWLMTGEHTTRIYMYIYIYTNTNTNTNTDIDIDIDTDTEKDTDTDTDTDTNADTDTDTDTDIDTQTHLCICIYIYTNTGHVNTENQPWHASGGLHLRSCAAPSASDTRHHQKYISPCSFRERENQNLSSPWTVPGSAHVSCSQKNPLSLATHPPAQSPRRNSKAFGRAKKERQSKPREGPTFDKASPNIYCFASKSKQRLLRRLICMSRPGSPLEVRRSETPAGCKSGLFWSPASPASRKWSMGLKRLDRHRPISRPKKLLAFTHAKHAVARILVQPARGSKIQRGKLCDLSF